MVPGGGFRGYGASQTTFAIESAMDDLAKLLEIDPFEIRRKNMIRPTDWVESVWKDPSDASFGSYGLDECMDIVESKMAKGGGAAKPEGDEWAEGSGIGLAHARMRSADGTPFRRADGAAAPTAATTLPSDRPRWGTARSRRTVRSPHRLLATRAEAIDIVNADTDLCPYDTGTFASTGTVVAGQAVELTAKALRDNIIEFASRHAGVAPTNCRLEDATVICGEITGCADRPARGRHQGGLALRGQAQGVPFSAHDRRSTSKVSGSRYTV